jgi:OHCU decarboxylase
MINKINKLPKSNFIKFFANIFESSKFIAEELYKKKGSSFSDFDSLSQKILDIFDNTTREQKLKILCSHPDLANKTKISSLTPDSKKEQQSVGLDSCSEEEYNEFEKLNDVYKKKFNFPFILAVKKKNKNEILESFRKRISSNLETEFAEAVKQVKQIAILRLEKLKNKDF